MEVMVGRSDEVKRLQSLAHSGRAEFVALYGRRRVGKTFLVNQVFSNQFAFKMTGVIEGTLNDQFTAFAAAMDDYGYDMPSQPKSWLSAFVMLKKALQHTVSAAQPCVIFIDELPALDAGGSHVASALGHFWNDWASMQDNLILIVCGSATSWMITHVIDSKGGLHDRLTDELPIHPFTLKEVEQYLEAHRFVWNRMMVLQTYMIFGGIPYYLSLLDAGESLVQNIDRLFFGRDLRLRREFRRLFNTLYRNPERYVDIVKTLSQSRNGMTRGQIAQAMRIDNNGHLGNKLEDLVCCDLVRKSIVRERELKRKDAIYQLCDFFSLFYLTFINRAEVEENYWSHHINTPEINAWMGLAYERVCMAHILPIKRALRIDGISTLTYSWRSKNSEPAAQIDMIIERADNIVNVCEVKFCQEEYELGRDEYNKIVNRKSAFIRETGLKHTPWVTMITTNGLAKGRYSEMVQAIVTLDDLFS